MGKIRIGLLIGNFHQPSWVYDIIENINSDSYAEIKLVVKNETISPNVSWIQRFRNNFNFYALYRRAEEKISKSNSDGFLQKDISHLVKPAGHLTIKGNESKTSEYEDRDDVSKILEYKIDVFLKFGTDFSFVHLLKTAKLGVWSFYHNDKYAFRGEPIGFWEFYYQKKEIGSYLEIVNDDDNDDSEVLYRSWSDISRIHQKSLSGFYLKTSLFVQRKLKELYEIGEENFLRKLKFENEPLQFYSKKLFRRPGNIQFLKVVFRNIISSIKYRIRTKFYFDQWIVLFSFGKPGSISRSIYKYKRIIPPSDRFWADPFVIFKDEKYFVFFEELIYKKKGEAGHLSVMEITKDGIVSEPKIILKKPYHLSYPFIFEYNNIYYMIPESSGDSTIQLYECTDFPYKWEFKMNLMENITAVDTTIFFKDNKFWLFVNVSEIPGVSKSEELFLFSSDSLFSNDWKSHPSNPIISDIRSARPAGRIFYHKGRLYRPSQDCSVAYGYSILLNEIVELTEEKYKEIKISDITPDWDKDVIATHTLSFDHDLTVIDAQIRRRKNLFSFNRKN